MIKYLFFGILTGMLISAAIYLSGDNYHIKSRSINLNIPGELEYLDGKTFDFKHIEDSDAVIYFWGSYCAPCIDKLPLLEQYAKTTKKPIILISQEKKEDQERYLSHFEYTNITFLRLTSSFKNIGVELIPKAILKEEDTYTLLSRKQLSNLLGN